MRRTAFALGMLLLSSLPTSAQLFWDTTVPTAKGHPNWIITGSPAGKQNAQCAMTLWFRDNSYFTLVKDQHDGELFMEIYVADWNINDPLRQIYQMRMEIEDGKRRRSLTFDYELREKNRIVIRDVNTEAFVDAWLSGRHLYLRMTGNIPDKAFPLFKTREGVREMVKCSQHVDKMKLNRQGLAE